MKIKELLLIVASKAKYISEITKSLKFLSVKVMFLIWIVTMVWFNFKPGVIAGGSDVMLESVKQQCADPKDNVEIVGGGGTSGDPDATGSFAHYYFGCSITPGIKSNKVLQPVIPGN